MADPKQDVAYKPFSSAAADSAADFWRQYCAARPSPTEDFLEQILAYHRAHGRTDYDLAHDVGTGPGNIAWRLAPYFNRVVGSDINDSALEAGRILVPDQHRAAVTLVKAAAEDLATATALPDGAGTGANDLVVVSECMPLLEREKSLEAFHTLLKPGGTLAIYFYGRPFFADGANAANCDKLYEQIASRICAVYQPFKGSPGEPFHRRSAEALYSYLDNVPMPPSSWAHVERHKWNADKPLIFNGREGYDFEWQYVDRRSEGEKHVEILNRDLWTENWDLNRVKAYLGSNYPKYRERAGEERFNADIAPLYAQLGDEMGGTRKMSFPLVLILATKH